MRDEIHAFAFTLLECKNDVKQKNSDNLLHTK